MKTVRSRSTSPRARLTMADSLKRSTKVWPQTISWRPPCSIAVTMPIGSENAWPWMASIPLIPALPTRCGRLPFDAQRYRRRNCIERFFNKLKQFRRLATRYDKLRCTFFAAVHLVAAFRIVRNS